MAVFPSPAEIAAQTPTSRDRAIDVIRIASLVAVVLGHTIMAVSTVRDGVFVWGNLLESLPALAALTWLLQIMPLFFFAGTAACVDSWSSGRSWGGWLMQRCTRLYRPVFFYLAFWAAALAVLRLVLPKHVYEPIAGTSIQLLWFLGAYVLVLAAIPLLYRITSVARFSAAVAAVYGFIVMIDILRLGAGAPSALGYINTLVWLIPGVFGVAYRRGLLRRSAAIAVAAGAFVVNVLLVWLGPYELSLVGYQGQRLPNMTPPSALLAGHAIMMCALAIAVAPAISRWARRARVWWLVAIGNSGAMTLYLWHMPALLGMHLVFAALGVPRYDPHTPGFVALSVVQVVLMAATVGVLFVALRPLENNPLPGWDGGFVAGPGLRSAAVGTLLCIAGGATLASVRWGLKDEGLTSIAVVLVALITARGWAADSKVPLTEAVTG